MSQAKVLTDQEFKRVLAVSQNTQHPSRNKLILYLSFFAGLRAGEISALRIDNIVDQSGNVRDRIMLIGSETKGNGQRTIVLSKKVRSEISSYLDQHGNLIEKRNWPLIRSQKGGHFSSLTMVMLFRRLFDAAGLDKAKSHSGRRTFITKLANSGINARVIQALAGHKNLQTTQAYIEINDDLLSKAIEAI